MHQPQISISEKEDLLTYSGDSLETQETRRRSNRRIFLSLSLCFPSRLSSSWKPLRAFPSCLLPEKSVCPFPFSSPWIDRERRRKRRLKSRLCMLLVSFLTKVTHFLSFLSELPLSCCLSLALSFFRSGRTARGGASGVCVCLVNMSCAREALLIRKLLTFRQAGKRPGGGGGEEEEERQGRGRKPEGERAMMRT